MKHMLLTACSAALSLCLALPVQADDTPIVIGVASGQTGTLEPWDKGAARGAELAVDDINAAGGGCWGARSSW
ncbi:ABC transporter substrate-binding protein [Gemmobacter sp. LW-1]|uniref:ABC transporter substrate-binding protein n=1 Tax=Gemmobacter sp. LW-1 TaxID=1529005 RepID=UPI0006C76D71|nr:ABC transporter substrate-binding protein [Gemmobacter sp. LW-1]